MYRTPTNMMVSTMKKMTVNQLMERRAVLKLKIECLLLSRPVTVGPQWQAAQEELAAITAELQGRDGVIVLVVEGAVL